jgi:hypothetical protein
MPESLSNPSGAFKSIPIANGIPGYIIFKLIIKLWQQLTLTALIIEPGANDSFLPDKRHFE